MTDRPQTHRPSRRVRFGFREGLAFGLGFSVPLFGVGLALLGLLVLLP